MLSTSIEQVLATLGVAVGYLVLIRLIDVNEREPIWSVLFAFVAGGAAAGALFLAADRVTLNFGSWPGAVLREVALFAALMIVFRVFAEIGRLEGWPLVSDALDGVIYGAAAGLGFNCGEAIAMAGAVPSLTIASTNVLDVAARSALAGLAQGVFGAMLGAGYAMAIDRTRAARWTWPIVALALAVVAHGGHHVLAHGNALAGEWAVWRSRLAVAVPLLAVVALGVFELFAERRAIARELADEVDTGDVTADEMALLTHVIRRQWLYLRLLAGARWAALRAAAALHNRQVMLALAKHRARGGDKERRAAAERHMAALRRAIREGRATLTARSGVAR